jgi:ribosome-binding protein aMBF1 (putative translation factor)
MKCELCGKRINEYAKYSAVIGKKEVNLCCWCHKKVKKGNEILREKNESNTKISRC